MFVETKEGEWAASKNVVRESNRCMPTRKDREVVKSGVNSSFAITVPERTAAFCPHDKVLQPGNCM